MSGVRRKEGQGLEWNLGNGCCLFFFFLTGTLSHFIVGIILGDNEYKEAVAVSVAQQTDKTFACRS